MDLKSNALRYDDRHFSQFGRSPRECIPCKERELFISESARKGDTTVTLRQKNRYIDEFLGFINDTYGFSEPQQLTAEHIIAF